MNLFSGSNFAQAMAQRPVLANEKPGRYVVLPAVKDSDRNLMVWEIGLPGVIMRGRYADRRCVEVGGDFQTLCFHDKEVAEDLASALNRGRDARLGVQTAQEERGPAKSLALDDAWIKFKALLATCRSYLQQAFQSSR